MIVRRIVRFFDERIGAAPKLRNGLRYVFPDHWSFMLGEIALYAFVVLVGTGIFLTFYYVPSDADVYYRGGYEPLQGVKMSEAYWSVVNLSVDVPAGLLIRQSHHWAANIFIGAIGLHMLRILFTGAFRKPREINYVIGLTMLALAIFNGFSGYSLIDDLYSGMGLAIAYSVLVSVPFVGEDAAFLAWGGEYPGGTPFWTRLFILHVLIVPVLIAGLIAAHLGSIIRQHHTQFPGGGRTAKNVVGSPMWPTYALRSIGLFLITAGVIVLLGGVVQINPIHLWGPYETYLSTNAAQPDYYLGWLIGGLRIMPPFELVIGDYTVVPNPFWFGLGFPTFVFAVLYLWPVIDRRLFGDRRGHELLDRPRDNPRRSAALVAFFGWVAIVLIAGAADRVLFRLNVSYEAQIWFFRIMLVVWPPVGYMIARRWFEELRRRDPHPLRGWQGRVVRRNEDGGFETVDGDGEVRQRESTPTSTPTGS
ncbi:MAG TPA: cytochrome bc complex cytochrome b subunit [Solirubrobacteraceae bacterium]|nr:cytochrome bc complex cytochrome b subunit [Solirubrobacteraceae bacterium]